ncbi:DUF5643 domain-containing protein [Virgibacillus sp. L01]|uniref:DUF5643 domain-containing protein n=1 Tax=Virgibacillus sp. L01 TaxID=3457429 RepID=UPI003FD40445
MKWIRRLIIVIALIILIPDIIILTVSTFDRDIPKDIQKQVDSGEAKMIDLDKEVTIGQDKIRFKHLVLSDDETTLIYEVHTEEIGWTFPSEALDLKDENGNTYNGRSGSSSSQSWGEFIIHTYKPLKDDVETVIIDFQWFDKSIQTEFSLNQEEL